MLEISMQISDAAHDFFGCGFHEVDGQAIALDDSILRRLHHGCESENVLVEGQGLFHVGNCEHWTYFLGGIGCGHRGFHLCIPQLFKKH